MRANRLNPWLLFGCLGLFSCSAAPSGSSDLGSPPASDMGAADLGTPKADAGVVTDAGPRPDTGVVTPDAGTCEDPGLSTTVRYKRARRIERHLLRALSLPAASLCNELGRFSCTSIHQVALGGLDPYNLGLYEPLPFTTATTPLAIDRLVLHACRERVQLDLNPTPDATPVLFDGLPINDAGSLSNIDALEVQASIQALYRRALSRDPNPQETAALRGLYTEVEAASTGSAARDWALLSCYAVFTTVESLFY